MSYDIRLGVKVADTDGLIVDIARPEYDTPTYNLRDMFVACMEWDYTQSEWYKVVDVLPKIERGIHELTFNAKKYRKYNPPNGWGNLEGALECLKSVLECIQHNTNGWENEIPIEHLWLKW